MNNIEILLDDKLYKRRTPNSKFIIYDKDDNKINSIEEIPNGILEILEGYKLQENNPEKYFEYEIRNNEVKILKVKQSIPYQVITEDFKQKVLIFIKFPEFIENLPVTSLGKNLLSEIEDCHVQILMPESIKTLEKQCFEKNIIKHISLSPLIKEIPEYCFWKTIIKSIDLKNVVHIKKQAFDDCISLSKVKMDKVEQIDQCAFKYCTSLEEITLPDCIEEIKEQTFFFSGIKRIKLPKNLKVIKESAFQRCTFLKELNFPENLTTIEANAFMDCLCLKELKTPNSLKTLGYSSFARCGLTKIELNKELNLIGSEAFKDCRALENITIYHKTKTNHDAFDFKQKLKIKKYK